MAKDSMPVSKDFSGGNHTGSKNSTAMYTGLEKSDSCCEVGNTDPNPYGPYLPKGGK